jgi:hypothetical protein
MQVKAYSGIIWEPRLLLILELKHIHADMRILR